LREAPPEEKASIVLRQIETHPAARLDLPEQYETRADLCRLDLSSETILARFGERLRRSPPTWWDADFRCANLSGANLQGAYLLGAKLPRVHLQSANLREAKLRLANLEGAHLLAANLRGASLSGASLRGASLVRAALQDAALRDTDLRDASLEYANLRGANLWKANLSGARLRDAKLAGAFLGTSRLGHAYFCGADLAGTSLRWQQLAGAIGEELDGDYGCACLGYLALEASFRALADEEGERWARAKATRMLKLQALSQHHWLRYLRAQVADLGRGFSQSFGRALTYLSGLTTQRHGSASPRPRRSTPANADRSRIHADSLR